MFPFGAFPLTTVASGRLPGGLPGLVSPLQRWPTGAFLGASLGSLGRPPGAPVGRPPVVPCVRSEEKLLRRASFCIRLLLFLTGGRRPHFCLVPGRLPGFPGPTSRCACRQEGFFLYSFASVPDRGSATSFLPLSVEVGRRSLNSTISGYCGMTWVAGGNGRFALDASLCN